MSDRADAQQHRHARPRDEPTGPLAGFRVLDLGHAGVGPYAAGLLAQMGADVIKCEPPWGDIINRAGGRDANQARPSDLYIAANMAKRGITINVKDDAERQLFFELVKTADVYMDNLRADAADGLGIGYDVLRAINPRLIFANSSGFGAEGPLRAMGSFEQYSDAFAGLPSVTGADGGPGQRRGGGLRIDPFAACCLVNMILAALLHRELTGEGQKIVGSQFQSALQLAMVRAIEPLNFAITPQRHGSGHPHVVPSGAYATRDGYVALTAETEPQWRNLCIEVGRPDLVFDPRFRDNGRRVGHRSELTEELSAVLAQRSTQEWIERFQARGVPAGAFLTTRDHLTDPHILSTGMLQTVESHWGPVTVALAPPRFSATPRRISRGPKPGEHLDEIVAEVAALDAGAS
jgi:crotonobetainyl-CoA:carnitine CoA-transferase CaiB-like acyl-CoA transferase